MLGNIKDSVINIHITEIKTLDIISNEVFSMRILEGQKKTVYVMEGDIT